MKKLRQISNAHYETILTYVVRAVNEGFISEKVNTRHVTMALMGCVHSAFSAKVVLGQKGKIETLGMGMIDLILKGVISGGQHEK